ncbi:MAG: hypothetical protein JWM98_418 [Thermoleophilia bacterium]|nr:hypothetical protein [Thermoleophilia bacterium]
MMADLLLYRRMRGVFWGLLVGGVLGVTTLFMLAVTVPAQLGWYADQTVRDLGGPASVAGGGFSILAIVATLAVVILGATAGSVDHQRGVLRDLVLAGRSRQRIVLGRVAGAAVLAAVVLAVGAAIVVSCAVAMPPVDSSVNWGRIAHEGLAYVPTLGATLLFSTGVALLVGSRGPAIAIYFVVSLLIDNVLRSLPTIGEWWEHVSYSAADNQVHQWIRTSGEETFDRSGWLALVVLVAWGVVALAAGLARLSRRDL